MKVITSQCTVETVVDKLLAAVEAANMRIVAHINGQANAAKMGKVVPADQILEIFRPDFAIRVWDACKPAGHDIPLRIHIYESGQDVIIACRLPSEVFAPFDSAELNTIGEELDSIFNGILEQIPEC